MSTAKTRIDESKLLRFFRDQLHIAEPRYEAIAEGEVSQAYFYETSEGRRVLRLNAHTKEGFLKDAYAAEHFCARGVPIPNVLEVGELEPGMFFSVSERAPGELVSKLSVNEVNRFMPEFVRVLDAIHSFPPGGQGYGYWSTDGNAKLSSWRHSVLANLEADDDPKLPHIDYFDMELHLKLKARVERLLDQFPHERQLLHGDYGFKNLLTDGTRITGVIDWHSSMYGDSLYDIAWLDFWRPDQGYSKHFMAHYEATNSVPDHFRERLLCYMQVAAVTSMAFFAKSNQPSKYEFSRKRVAEIAPDRGRS